MARGLGFAHLRKMVEKVERDLRSVKGVITKLENAQFPDEEKPDKIQEFIAFYCDRWKEKYKYTPKLSGRSIGALKTILRDFRTERAQRLVVAYLTMSDAFYIKRRHDPETLLSNAMAVGHYADSGKLITNDDTRQMERTHKSQTLFDMVDKGQL